MVKETVSVDSKEDGSVLVDVVPISIVSPVFPILELLVELFTCFVGERTSAVGMVVGVGNVVGFTVGHILFSALVLFAPESGVGKDVGQNWLGLVDSGRSYLLLILVCCVYINSAELDMEVEFPVILI